MHELSIVQEIYQMSRTAVAAHGAGRLERVRIAVGELTAIEPDLLTFAWEAVTAGGPDAGSALDVDWRPARQFCPTCTEEKPRAERAWLRVCPDCGSALEVDGGQELDLLQVVFMPDGDAEPGEGERAGHG